MSDLGKFYPELEIREEEIEILKGKSGGYLHLVLQKSLLAVEYLRQGCTETVRLDLLRRLNEFIGEHHTPALEDFNTVFSEPEPDPNPEPEPEPDPNPEPEPEPDPNPEPEPEPDPEHNPDPTGA